MLGAGLLHHHPAVLVEHARFDNADALGAQRLGDPGEPALDGLDAGTAERGFGLNDLEVLRGRRRERLCAQDEESSVHKNRPPQAYWGLKTSQSDYKGKAGSGTPNGNRTACFHGCTVVLGVPMGPGSAGRAVPGRME